MSDLTPEFTAQNNGRATQSFPYKCRVCGQKFRSEGGLNLHQEETHSAVYKGRWIYSIPFEDGTYIVLCRIGTEVKVRPLDMVDFQWVIPPHLSSLKVLAYTLLPATPDVPCA